MQPRYLSERERIRIADLLAAKMTVRGIAGEIGRSPSTVSREIRRNSDPDGRYRPHHAEHAARERTRRPRTRKVTVDAVLAGVIARLLAKRWSPEQVAHELRILFAGQRRRWLCVESIYQAIYDPAVGLTRPARRRRRRRRLRGAQRRGRLTAMTPRIARGIATLSASIPASEPTFGRSAERGTELESGTTTISSQGPSGRLPPRR